MMLTSLYRVSEDLFTSFSGQFFDILNSVRRFRSVGPIAVSNVVRVRLTITTSLRPLSSLSTSWTVSLPTEEG